MMSYCTWKYRVEAYHDGEAEMSGPLEAHLRECPRCKGHLASLEMLREGVVAVRKDVVIADAQFRAFMDGIREGVSVQPSRWGVLFSRVSLFAAGLVLVAALSYIVTSGPVRTWADQVFNGGPSEDTISVGPDFNGGVNPRIKGDLQ